VNNVRGDVEFIVGSAHEVPLPDNSVDIVFGIAILHHLDLALSAREVLRLLRPGGRAIFQEPVRSSRLLKVVRKLIPYRAPHVSPYERPLTKSELSAYAKGFSSSRVKEFTLPTTGLVNVVPALRRRLIHRCYKWDATILRNIPALRYYATVNVMELVK
jgi:ubiquinone/menaquinone biosynthesis C-methylase UbiE